MHLISKAPGSLAGDRRGGSAFEGGFNSDPNSPVWCVLDRLCGVQRAGRGWVARCPAHDDRNPSLAVGVGQGDAVLLHCFAGCAAPTVVAAIGLTLGDLFPKSLAPVAPGRSPQSRQRISAEAAWRAAAGVVLHEATIIEVAASDLMRVVPLSSDDRARLSLAADRIRQAWEVLRAHRNA